MYRRVRGVLLGMVSWYATGFVMYCIGWMKPADARLMVVSSAPVFLLVLAFSMFPNDRKERVRLWTRHHTEDIERLISFLAAFGLGGVVLLLIPDGYGVLVGGIFIFVMALVKILLSLFARRESYLEGPKKPSADPEL